MAGVNYVMLPAVLHCVKYMRLMFYLHFKNEIGEVWQRCVWISNR